MLAALWLKMVRHSIWGHEEGCLPIFVGLVIRWLHMRPKTTVGFSNWQAVKKKALKQLDLKQLENETLGRRQPHFWGALRTAEGESAKEKPKKKEKARISGPAKPVKGGAYFGGPSSTERPKENRKPFETPATAPAGSAENRGVVQAETEVSREEKEKLAQEAIVEVRWKSKCFR